MTNQKGDRVRGAKELDEQLDPVHLAAENLWLKDLVKMMDRDHCALGGGDWHLPPMYQSLLDAIRRDG